MLKHGVSQPTINPPIPINNGCQEEDWFSQIPKVPRTSNCRILLYHTFKAGDVINFTSILTFWKKYYPNVEIDFLTWSDYSSILETNKNIDNLLFLEDYKEFSLLRHAARSDPAGWEGCTLAIDNLVRETFGKRYDFYINFWPIFYAPILYSVFPAARVADNYIEMSLFIPKLFGFDFPMTVQDNMPIFYFTRDDRRLVDEFVRPVKGKKLAIFDHISGSWQANFTPNADIIIERLHKHNFTVIGNYRNCDLSLANLNLRQIKLLFQRHCRLFVGCNSGMTSSILSKPTRFKGKALLLEGLDRKWDYYNWFEQKPEKYLFLTDNFSLSAVENFLGDLK